MEQKCYMTHFKLFWIHREWLVRCQQQCLHLKFPINIDSGMKLYKGYFKFIVDLLPAKKWLLKLICLIFNPLPHRADI